MKSTISLLVLLFICNLSFAQKSTTSDTTLKKVQKGSGTEKNISKIEQETQEVHITPGVSGVKRSIGYKFSDQVTDGDPGPGIFRYNKGTVSEVAFIFVDNIDISGEDQTKWYSTWDKTTGATGRGRITVADKSGKIITVFYFTDVFRDAKGYWKLPVEHVSGTVPSADSVYYYVFDRIAHNDESGKIIQGNEVKQKKEGEKVAEVKQETQVAQETEVKQEKEAEKVAEVKHETQVAQVAEVKQEKEAEKVAEVKQETQVAQVAEVKQEKEAEKVAEVKQENQVAQVAEVKQEKEAEKVAEVKQETQVAQVAEVKQEKEAEKVAEVKQENQVAQVAEVKLEKEAEKVAEVKQENQVAQVAEVKQEVQVNKVNEEVAENKFSQIKKELKVLQTNESARENQTVQPKPVIQSTETTQPKTVTQPAQTTQPKPVTQPVQTQSKPVTQTAQTTQPKPVTQPAQTTQPKPVTQPVQTNQPKPVTQSAQTNQSKPPIQPTQQKPIPQPTQPPQGSQLPVYQNNYASQEITHRKCYRGIIEAGYGLGLGDYGISNFRFNFINGFKIGNSSLGLGIGFRRYFTENNTSPFLVARKSQIPVFIDFRTTFSSRRVTPYFALGLGGIAKSDSTAKSSEGLFFTTSGGIWFNISDRFAVFTGIAYEMQKLEFSDSDPSANNYFKNSNSLSLNIGIAF